MDQNTLRVTWKPPEREDWNGEIQGYYVGYKLTSSDKPYLFETVEFSKEEGKEHHLQIGNLKQVFITIMLNIAKSKHSMICMISINY